MKILVYGAGPLGSLFAARLQQGGNDVSLLSRGGRLADLREHGIVLHNVTTNERSATHVNLVETLEPDDRYDLVLVIMRKNHALGVLPVLGANQHTPNVLFLGNNAAGPQALVEALGAERVLIGFLSSAGYFEGHVVHCLMGRPEDPVTFPIGEVDGRITHRTHHVARMLETAPGYRVEIRSDMDAWLKTHVALLFPSLGPALYAAGIDKHRLARTRDALVLAVRAIREGFAVLRALDIPITPSKFAFFEWMPEPILVAIMRWFIQLEQMDVALVGHAQAARDEAQHLTDEFRALSRQANVPTPAIDRLYPYLHPETPLMPDGQSEIPLDWDTLLIALGALLGAAAGAVMIGRRLRRRRRRRR